MSILASNRKKIIAYLLGIGMVLFVVHNPQQPLLNILFLPHLGLVLVYTAIILSLRDINKKSLGHKMVYIPLLIIVGSIVASVATQGMAGLSLALFGVTLFGVYLVARTYGSEIFKPFAWAVVVGTIGTIIYGLASPGVKTGGFISPTNYDMATGLLVFGVMVSMFKQQWLLMAVALVGLFFTGADEAVFAVGFILLFILIRKDISLKLLFPVATLIIVAVLCIPSGITYKLYSPTFTKLSLLRTAVLMDKEVKFFSLYNHFFFR